MQSPSRRTSRFLARGLAILYEDRDILVVDKPSGLLTVGTEREKARTAYFALTDYVRKGDARSRNRIFIVHRLDRETSGVLVFAKTAEAKFCLQGRWDETKKRYLAVVHGKCEKRSETITTYLAENSAHGVYSTADTKKGKLSQTAYTVLKETKDLALLDVELLTGRKHQIRVHLADRGTRWWAIRGMAGRIRHIGVWRCMPDPCPSGTPSAARNSPLKHRRPHISKNSSAVSSTFVSNRQRQRTRARAVEV